MGSYRMCGCFTRKFSAGEVRPPDEVKDLFNRYADAGASAMSVDGLRRFLVEVQKEEEGEGKTKAGTIIDQIQQRKWPLPKQRHPHLSLDDFYHFLFSPDLNPPLKTEVHHDMTAPLSHYYIFTGHNSYLTGNQLNSDCSDVPIIKALQRGVRVIELDLWPNSKKDNILVLHGRTLTTPVELIKCLKSIKVHAFSASPYPVIVTLEDHLTADLQAKVAQMVSETFGDMLFYPESGSLQKFPSPESLKHRILISTKPPKEYLEASSFKDNGSQSQKGKETDEDSWGKEVPDVKEEIESDAKEDVDTFQLHPDGDDEDDDNKLSQGLHKGVSEYKRIITIHAGKLKGGMKNWLKVEENVVRRLSLSEQELAKAIATHPGDLVRFTQHNLLRVYPKGIRVDSSNYNPLIGWMYGAQLVALNMQGYDRSLWLMHGFFKANGSCGYVKKPVFLLNNGGATFDPQAKLPVKKTLKVTVYMGDGWNLDFKKTHFDTYSPPDFYTRVGIAGVPADTIMKKTKTIEDNWSPSWNEEFQFPLTVPELALLRIEVHEYDMSEKDDFGGQACFPISELQTGIRTVPLFDKKGEKFSSVKLLMRFELS
ncbi:Phosphoinositide phospholipase C 6 [Nymphaea thermarum]|nr:Phosphoinositide phospholipase C 6 [Nymphaea thermarum]